MAASLDKRYKSILFEYCQKRKIGPPSFDTRTVEGETSGYQSEVTIEETTFGWGQVLAKKKQAESDAARVCLIALGLLNEAKNDDTNENQTEIKEEQAGDGIEEQKQSTEGDQKTDEVLEETIQQEAPSHPSLDTSPFGYPRAPPSVAVMQSKKPKSVLHEYCQKLKLPHPQYETQESFNGTKFIGFTCTLNLNDETYTCESSVFPTKRDAEHFVAGKALAVLNHAIHSPSFVGSKHTPPSGSLNNPALSYKNLLQEHLHQRNLDGPVYNTELTGSGYRGTVTIEGKVVNAQQECTTKKLAEQNAAKAGLIELGIKDPDAVALRLFRRRSKGQFPIPAAFPFKTKIPTGNDKETWIHTRSEMNFDSDVYDEADSGYIDFQLAESSPLKRSHDSTDEETPNKRQRVGDSSVSRGRPSYPPKRRRDDAFDVADAHLGNMSVGEAWPEKKNVVIIGSGETSIPLYCNADYGRCALEDKTAASVVDILPGHRLIGLEGHYIERGGQIVLRARQCQEVVSPTEPDKVLVSCGVVVLHCIPRKSETGNRCDVNILLKRYLCSQAFINVVRSLAQFFRSKIYQRPVTLNKSLIISHITEWMLEEVMAIASMTEESVRNVFRHTMKFDRRWGKILNAEELPEELKELQSVAQEELSHRASTLEDQNQDRYRPWRLPKGNFHHRILSTGVFIESPAECAMRELREETGIRLKLNDIASSPYIDLYQADNLNPHKGDVARYYLCGIITEDEASTAETNKSEQPTEEMQVNPTVDTAGKAEAKTPDKSRDIEDANIIRSPSVAGALHEECTWYDVESAKDTSKIFNEVYQSSEFQKLLATLKNIVSEM